MTSVKISGRRQIWLFLLESTQLGYFA